MKKEVERAIGHPVTMIYDWAFGGLPSHRVYHQDELAYMEPLASCYTAWLLLDGAEGSPCSGLDIIPYERNKRLYEGVFRNFDQRCLLLSDAIFGYNEDSSADASKGGVYKRALKRLGNELSVSLPRLRAGGARLKCLLRRPKPPPLMRNDHLLSVERYEDLQPGDFVVFNTGLFHSCSNPIAVEAVGHKFFYKVAFIRSDALVSKNQVDDFCPHASLSKLRPGMSFASADVGTVPLFIRVGAASEQPLKAVVPHEVRLVSRGSVSTGR
jgi:hypothetical protein